MILSSAREFERWSNPEIVERPSDNVEVPQVSFTIYTIFAHEQMGPGRKTNKNL
jgi:hypothetical protein